MDPCHQKSSKFYERSFVLAYERVVNITSCTSILQEFFRWNFTYQTTPRRNLFEGQFWDRKDTKNKLE